MQNADSSEILHCNAHTISFGTCIIRTPRADHFGARKGLNGFYYAIGNIISLLLPISAGAENDKTVPRYNDSGCSAVPVRRNCRIENLYHILWPNMPWRESPIDQASESLLQVGVIWALDPLVPFTRITEIWRNVSLTLGYEDL
jgi:hypothetical protein